MKDLFKFPLNIQLFADEGPDVDPEDKNQPEEDDKPEEKTFTQEEVNALIAKEKARAKNKVKQKLKQEEPTEADEDVEQEPQVNPYLERYAQAEIKVAMTTQGIDPNKVNRAVRLIDHNTVLTEDGDIDVEKLNGSIADLLKEWPELAPANEVERKGFKIGGDGSDGKGDLGDEIAKAFGNK